MRNINEALHEHLTEVLKIYPEDQILGVFAYGSMNYGTYIKGISDVDTKAIIIPTFRELCLNDKPVSRELHFENGEHCEIKDIREIVKMFKKQNINFLEILFTEYCWLNPMHKVLWKIYFCQFKEDIVRFDENKAWQSIIGQAIHTLKQNPTNGKKISNGYRLLYFLEQYKEGKPYLECIKPTEENLATLLQFKKCSYLSTNYAKDLIERFEEMKEFRFPKKDNSKLNNWLNNGIEYGIRHLDNIRKEPWRWKYDGESDLSEIK